ncbi:hypothetical protein H310_14411 [Aphanomyces invadans]|uniref:Peptidase C51 domain-containing protein n=1 Tax=Aphanomyces invadans TaxID=157072 RepID=A0A024T9X7_9STRA|nr:hypothetical protein H310_14411 [Aphanomyces invadans]ETV90925.1 hypothetical protein H310_14411 [Aphanomyces invadans]|eukprot:XP_008880490.1 hypothetical protein H310_14411 [Aphanomyces invadans]
MGRRRSAFLVFLSVAICAVASLHWAPFGTILGVTDGNVEVYSCHLDPGQEALDQASNYVNGTYTGVQWQCVELARRYLLVNYGVVFGDVDYAFQIFDLDTVDKVSDGSKFALNKFVNGGSMRPERGSLLIWDPTGEMAITGHVAVVVDVTDSYVDIVEQNVEDTIWPTGQLYSRRLKVKQNSSSYFVEKWYNDEHLLGWVTVDLSKPVVPLNSMATSSLLPTSFVLSILGVSAAVAFVVFRKRRLRDYDLVH